MCAIKNAFKMCVLCFFIITFILDANASIIIDGVYTTGEDWDSVTPIEPPSGNSKCYVYNDGDYIYILVDWIADITNDSDEYNYFRFTEADKMINVRVYVNGELDIWPLSTDATAESGWASSPNKAEVHRQYEMKCSLSNIGVDVGDIIDNIWIWDKDKSQNAGYTWYEGWAELAAPSGTPSIDPDGIGDDNPDPEPPDDISLYVELSSFTATYKNNKISLCWTTESEIENLGFNIYRSCYPDDQYGKINDLIIPGAGNSSFQHKYEYVDDNITNGVTYWYKLEDIDYRGISKFHGPLSITPTDDAKPTDFYIFPNHPNPFNISTTISYQLPEPLKVIITIYNSKGNLVETLVKEHKEAGYYSVEWNADDIGSGLYFFHIQAGDYVSTKKCLLIK